MKKIITSVITFLIIALSWASIALADDPLVPQRTTPDQANLEHSYIGIVQQLPGSSWTQILAAIIQFILAITGSLAIISFTYGGIMMITAQGKDEQIGKGKGILMWSVLALIIIAASYAIVIGISNLELV